MGVATQWNIFGNSCIKIVFSFSVVLLFKVLGIEISDPYLFKLSNAKAHLWPTVHLLLF